MEHRCREFLCCLGSENRSEPISSVLTWSSWWGWSSTGGTWSAACWWRPLLAALEGRKSVSEGREGRCSGGRARSGVDGVKDLAVKISWVSGTSRKVTKERETMKSLVLLPPPHLHALPLPPRLIQRLCQLRQNFFSESCHPLLGKNVVTVVLKLS